MEQSLITSSPEVMEGTPVANTCGPVRTLFEYLESL